MGSFQRIFEFLFFTFLSTSSYAKFASDPPFFSQEYAVIPSPREIVLDTSGDLLVSSGRWEPGSKIYVVYERLNETDGSLEVVSTPILEDSLQLQMKIYHS